MSKFTVDDLRNTIESCLGGGGGTEPVVTDNIDIKLDDLGYDSLSIYEFVTKLQDDLHISITDEEIDSLHTPRAVIDLVNERRSESRL
jgi:acyl carrier protein